MLRLDGEKTRLTWDICQHQGCFASQQFSPGLRGLSSDISPGDFCCRQRTGKDDSWHRRTECELGHEGCPWSDSQGHCRGDNALYSGVMVMPTICLCDQAEPESALLHPFRLSFWDWVDIPVESNDRLCHRRPKCHNFLQFVRGSHTIVARSAQQHRRALRSM